MLSNDARVGVSADPEGEAAADPFVFPPARLGVEGLDP